MNFLKNILYRLRGYTTIDSLKKEGLICGDNFNPQFPFFLDPSHCWLITIGDNVTFGPNVSVFAHDAASCKHGGYARIGKVTIGNNVFIGAGSIILPNVTIGDNSIVGAGSVVTSSIPADMVYAGSPARAISTIAEYDQKISDLMKTRPVYDESFTTRANVDCRKKQQQIEELDDGVGFVK